MLVDEVDFKDGSNVVVLVLAADIVEVPVPSGKTQTVDFCCLSSLCFLTVILLSFS